MGLASPSFPPKLEGRFMSMMVHGGHDDDHDGGEDGHDGDDDGNDSGVSTA